MPIGAIKIDNSFIDLITTDNKSYQIVCFLINLGRTIGTEVIAEGVDNEEQVVLLQKAHLNTIQGYYYSKPLPKKEYDDLLLDNKFEKKGASK